MVTDTSAGKQTLDVEATRNAIREKAPEQKVEQWVYDKLEGVLGEKGIRNEKEPVTPSGKKRSFAQLHNPYTLENLVKAMNSQNARGQDVWGVSASTLMSTTTAEYKNLDEVRADKERLRQMPEAEYKKLLEDADSQIEQVIRMLRKETTPHSDNSFEEQEILGEILLRAAQGKHTAAAIGKAFAKEGYIISKDAAQRILALYKDVAKIPTGYFEAKPQRAVGFDEVRAAILPDNASEALVQQLKDAGVPVQLYKAGDDEARTALLNKVPNVRFALAQQADREAKGSDQRQASRAIADKAAALDTLGQFFGLTRGVKVSRDSLEGLAVRWTRTNGSRADRTKLANEAQVLVEYLKAEGADMGKAQALAETLAGEVLDGATYRNSELWDEYPELHKLEYTVNKTGAAKAELVRRYGSWGEAVAEARRDPAAGRGRAGRQPGGAVREHWIRVERGDKVAIIHLYTNAGEATVTENKVGIVCFYDENKSFVGSFCGEKTGFVTTSVDVPEIAAYVRLCRWHDSTGGGDSTGEAWIVHGEKDTQEEVEVLKECIGQPVEFTLDGYLTGVGKYYTGNTYGKVTDYIALGSYSKVAFYRLYGNHKDDTSVNESVGIVCFYRDESEETFISSAYNYYGFASDVVTVPAEAKYVRLCKWSYVTACGKAFLCGETQKSTSEDEQKIADIAARNAIAKLESINKPFLFSGKTINAFGDSITAGVTSPGLKQGTPYIKYFADHVGAKLNNWAVSGSTLSVLESWSPGSICKRVMDVLPKDMGDYIFIAGGTNDFNQNREIGSLDSKDNATVCGAVNNMCEYIKLNLSDRTVIFITPIPYTQAYYSRNPAVNKLGNTLEDYIKAIYQVATLHGYNVVNGYALGMPTGAGAWDNAMCDNSDGCHPAELGHKLYARSLAGKLL